MAYQPFKPLKPELLCCKNVSAITSLWVGTVTGRFWFYVDIGIAPLMASTTLSLPIWMNSSFVAAHAYITVEGSCVIWCYIINKTPITTVYTVSFPSFVTIINHLLRPPLPAVSWFALISDFDTPSPLRLHDIYVSACKNKGWGRASSSIVSCPPECVKRGVSQKLRYFYLPFNYDNGLRVY